MRKIRLTGALRYFYKGILYEAGKTYAVKSPTDELLLRATDDQTGMKYFSEVKDVPVGQGGELPPPPPPEPKTDEEIEAELDASDEDAVVVEDNDVHVEDLTDEDLI